MHVIHILFTFLLNKLLIESVFAHSPFDSLDPKHFNKIEDTHNTRDTIVIKNPLNTNMIKGSLLKIQILDLYSGKSKEKEIEIKKNSYIENLDIHVKAEECFFADKICFLPESSAYITIKGGNGREIFNGYMFSRNKSLGQLIYRHWKISVLSCAHSNNSNITSTQ